MKYDNGIKYSSKEGKTDPSNGIKYSSKKGKPIRQKFHQRLASVYIFQTCTNHESVNLFISIGHHYIAETMVEKMLHHSGERELCSPIITWSFKRRKDAKLLSCKKMQRVQTLARKESQRKEISLF